MCREKLAKQIFSGTTDGKVDLESSMQVTSSLFSLFLTVSVTMRLSGLQET
jgi:hypothetical protein